MNVDNITAAIVQYLTLGEWPATDANGLPLFAYGARVHATCERLPFLRAGQVALDWGDAGHRAGWCLRRIGCQGPLTNGNCATVKFNSATSWPVAAGSPCIGCTRPGFWDLLPAVVAWTPPVQTPTLVAG
jgi:hydrogenase small subunit